MRLRRISQDTDAMTPVDPEHEQRKCDLRMRGTSLREIAAAEGVLPSSVSAVSQGRRRSRRIEAAIAHALDRRVEDVFHDRYKKDSAMK